MNDASTPPTASGSAVNDYDQTGGRYDEFRRPMGFRLLIEACQRTARRLDLPIDQLTMLAAGCGTGNYEARMLQHWRDEGTQIGTLHLADHFVTMLDQAREKVTPFGVLAGAHQVDLINEDVPVEDGSVHVASLVECIHHFDRGNRLHPHTEAVFERMRRKIATGGSLSIISTTPTQSRKSRWYALAGQFGGLEIAQDPGVLYADQYPRMELIIPLLEDAGFKCEVPRRVMGPYIREDVYYDAEQLLEVGPFAVSFFRFAQDRALFGAYADGVRHLIEIGQVQDVIAESERWRKKIGTAYMLEAVAI